MLYEITKNLKKLKLINLVFLLILGCSKEEIFTFPSGKIRSEEIFYQSLNLSIQSEYKYNEIEQLTKIIKKNDGREVGSINYFYNERGLVSKEEVISDGDYTFREYLYNDDGKLTSQRGSDISYDVIYDDSGRVESKRYYTYAFQKKNFIYYTNLLYAYEDANQISDEITIYNSSETVYSHLNYIYDNYGRIEQKKLVDGNEWFYRGTKEFYAYDLDGRLFKKIVYELNTLQNFGVESTSTYYYFK